MPGPVQSVERAASMLQILAADTEPMALGQVAAALGLAKGTAHGILRTLRDVGFVQQDAAGRYHLGAAVLQLGSTSLDINELRCAAINWVDTLAEKSGRAAGIAAFRDGQGVLAHHVTTTAASTGSYKTGSQLHLHASAFGKVLLAFDPGAARSVAGTALESLTFRTNTDRTRVPQELATIRETGVATCVEEVEPGLAEIAAPVRDQGGYVIAAVGVDGPLSSVCDDRLRPRPELICAVTDVARELSRALGHGTLS